MTHLIGGYRIVTHLGRGYQADTFKIKYGTNGHRHAALKQFRADAYQSQTLLANEYKSLMRLRKDSKPSSIPDILHYSARGRYLIMEYVAGQPMVVPQDKRQAFLWWFGLAETVIYAHAQGVFHCDINPTNVLVNGDSVALIDWASSKRARSPINSSKGLPRGHWQPPEQPAGQLGRKTDIFSLAAMLLWLISGYKPRDPIFQGPNRRSKQIITSVLERSLKNADCRPLAACLEKGLAGDPQLRYNSAKRLYNSVRNWYRRYYES